MTWGNAAGLLAILAAIIGAIYYLETTKPQALQPNSESVVAMPSTDKEKKYESAKELVTPSSFINTDPFKIADLIGKQVVLVDFWTYSCINCQRTLPYLNAWHDKYHKQGLTIVGVHTPEFDFEKVRDNVIAATKKYQVQYPVVQDNDYATWQAYRNRYWPRKYLIDIDGYIVYDHIGEGGYAETEQKIQELLTERQQRLATAPQPSPSLVFVPPAPAVATTTSPEIYFGASRNEQLGNGNAGQTGVQDFAEPTAAALNQVYLIGQWEITPEYAESKSSNAAVLMKYQAQEVNVVAGATPPLVGHVTRDGQPVTAVAGKNIITTAERTAVTIAAEDLYRLINDPAGAGEHELKIIFPEPGVRLFTFTFG